MVSDKVELDFGVDFDDSNYKSCFARSVAVNSQYRQSKLSDVKTNQEQQLQHHQQNGNNSPKVSLDKGSFETVKLTRRLSTIEAAEFSRIRKEIHKNEEKTRYIFGSVCSSRRTSICSNRITEIPVENFVLQSQVDTLQWQLKQTEASREMYRQVMKQVVTFLERAHRSLELLGSRLNTKQQSVPRSKSEHEMSVINADTFNETIVNSSKTTSTDYSSFRDFTWRRPKKQQLSSEEIPPEKLSQEAFRLLRTAQSLLNTREPDLARVGDDKIDELEFMTQLAKEFPQIPETRPQRTTSFSLSPKLLTPEKDTRISLNRKLSLQFNANDSKRNFFNKDVLKMNKLPDSARGSVAESEFGVISPILHDFHKEYRNSNNSQKSLNGDKFKFRSEPEKSNSPPMGSISSAEDESGFSSMNSFQDIGVPIINSTISEEITTKDVLLRSMLHNGNFTNSCGSRSNSVTPEQNDLNSKAYDDVKLWQKPDPLTTVHKRWNSTPVQEINNKEKPSLKVLWV